MKNLKLFVFALCAVLLSVVTVNAADDCVVPTGTKTAKDCEAVVTTLDGEQVGYLHAYVAWGDVAVNGGTIKLYVDLDVSSARNLSKNVTVDTNTNTLTITSSGALKVLKGATLTFNNSVVTAHKTIEVADGGNLIFNNAAVTSDEVLVKNAGTTTVNGGTITLTGHSVFDNAGTLKLNNVTKITTPAYLVGIAHNSDITINGGKYVVNALFLAPSADPVKQPFGSDVADEVAAKLVVKAGTIAANAGSTVDGGMNVTFENAEYNVVSGKALSLKKGTLTVNGGSVTAQNGDAIGVLSAADEAKLIVVGGTVESTKNGYALALSSTKATYAISGGTFESKGAKDQAAIYLPAGMATKVNGKVVLNEAVSGILTGGLYLNRIIAEVVVDGGTYYNVYNQLVAEGYTVKDTKKDNKDYKEVVSTKASTDTTKPGAPGKEEAPNTFDAGLVYMGLALSAIGASVVSVRKLRNN